jgi:hypothetical protein
MDQRTQIATELLARIVSHNSVHINADRAAAHALAAADALLAELALPKSSTQ